MFRKPPGKPPSQRPGRAGHEKAERYDANDIRYIAIHEAGHAVAAVVLGLPLNGVDIKRRRMPGGEISMGFTDSPVTFKEGEDRKEKALALLIQSMAGPLSEVQINPNLWDSNGYHADVNTGRQIAAIALCEAKSIGGGKAKVSSEEMARRKPEMDALISRAAKDAGKLVQENLAAIIAVANLLIERTALTPAEVAEIVKSPPQVT